MAEIYKLRNKFKHYEWGSKTMMPEFLNIDNKKASPYAEMWMGNNRGAPSQVCLNGDRDSGDLKDLIEVSGELPFLFKLLAVEKPLSIQAHPDKKQAQAGFKKEEESMLSMNAPTRNYKDDNHKPEIFCALSDTALMAGFKEPDEIRESFTELLFLLPVLNEIVAPFIGILKTGSLSQFFRMLCYISRLEQEYLCSFIKEIDVNNTGETCKVISCDQWKLIKKFAKLYPSDPAILSPLYLNYIKLTPGQAVYIPAGVLHAYLSGFGLEVMANSDNVLRGGLTPKHVDTGELMNILQFNPFKPDIITPPDNASSFDYHTSCGEFLLVFMRGEQEFKKDGPAICFITKGELKIDNLIFRKGDSFFIPKGSAAVSFKGNYSLYAACHNM